jgi:hypothetical protein
LRKLRKRGTFSPKIRRGPLSDEQPPAILLSTQRRFAFVASLILLLIFIADAHGNIKIDGWAIVLLIMAAIPWSFPSVIRGLRELGNAFNDAHITSLELGAVKIQMLEQKVSDQDEQINEQRRILDDLAVYSMAWYIYDKLQYLSLGVIDKYKFKYSEYLYRNNEPFNHDLRYLRDHGYLDMFQFQDLKDGENLVGRIKVTNMGQRFVEIKEGISRPALTKVVVAKS